MTDSTASAAGAAEQPATQQPATQQPDEETLELARTLLDAARKGETEMLRSYLNAGAPATLTNHAGDSLVMLAAYHGHAETVQLILHHGGDANAVNDRGQTPLAGAVFKGYPDVVRALVDAGADPDAGSPSARDAARMFARTDILEMLG